jgi:hypothetical protein
VNSLRLSIHWRRHRPMPIAKAFADSAANASAKFGALLAFSTGPGVPRFARRARARQARAGALLQVCIQRCAARCQRTRRV